MGGNQFRRRSSGLIGGTRRRQSSLRHLLLSRQTHPGVPRRHLRRRDPLLLRLLHIRQLLLRRIEPSLRRRPLSGLRRRVHRLLCGVDPRLGRAHRVVSRQLNAGQLPRRQRNRRRSCLLRRLQGCNSRGRLRPVSRSGGLSGGHNDAQVADALDDPLQTVGRRRRSDAGECVDVHRTASGETGTAVAVAAVDRRQQRRVLSRSGSLHHKLAVGQAGRNRIGRTGTGAGHPTAVRVRTPTVGRLPRRERSHPAVVGVDVVDERPHLRHRVPDVRVVAGVRVGVEGALNELQQTLRRVPCLGVGVRQVDRCGVPRGLLRHLVQFRLNVLQRHTLRGQSCSHHRAPLLHAASRRRRSLRRHRCSRCGNRLRRGRVLRRHLRIDSTPQRAELRRLPRCGVTRRADVHDQAAIGVARRIVDGLQQRPVLRRRRRLDNELTVGQTRQDRVGRASTRADLETTRRVATSRRGRIVQVDLSL